MNLRLVVVVLLIASTVFGAAGVRQQAAGTGNRIRVTVRLADSTEPLAGVRLALTPLAGGPALTRGGVTPSAGFSAGNPSGATILTTGPDGIALFEKLSPGGYSIRAEGDGYLTQTVAATAFATQQTDISISLNNAGSISGRVLDAFGVPMPTARVMVGTLGYREGRRVFTPQGTAQPDGFGNYVVSPLGKGDYYVRMEQAPTRGVGTYYPSVIHIDDAIKVPVETGRNVVGLDFNASSLPVFKVSGTVINLPAGTTTLPNLSFTPADPRNADPQSAPLLPNGRRGSAGEFEVTLPAGLWDVFPVIPTRQPTAAAPGATFAAASPLAQGLPTYATGRARVLVKDRDVENVTVAIAASDINGRILVEGEGAAALPSGLRVTLLPQDNYPSPLLSHLRAQQIPQADGSIAFKSVPPGRYSLQLAPWPAGFYLADMRLGSKSIYDDGVIAVGTEPLDGPLEVTLRRNGGRIQVTAAAYPPAPPNRGAATLLRRLVLVPASPRENNVLLHRSTISPATGTRAFFQDVAPGNYRLFAFEALPTGGAEQNAEFMEKYQSLGVPVHVEAGQVVDVQVQWIPADE